VKNRDGRVGKADIQVFFIGAVLFTNREQCWGGVKKEERNSFVNRMVCSTWPEKKRKADKRI